MNDVKIIYASGEHGVVDLKDYNLSPRHETALWFNSPEGNDCSASYACVKEGYVWLWLKDHWLCISTTHAQGMRFDESITLLPLPDGADIYAALGASLFRQPKIFRLPIEHMPEAHAG